MAGVKGHKGQLSDSTAAELQAFCDLALDAAQLGRWRWNATSGEFDCSARCLSLLGCPGSELTFDGFLAGFHIEDRPALDQALRRLARGAGDLDLVCRTNRNDAHLRIKAVAVDSAEPDTVQILGVVMEGGGEELSPSDSRLAAIVASSDDAIISTTLEGVVTTWNRGAERVFGYTADEMIGQSNLALAAPGHDDDILAVLAKIRGGEPVDHYQTVRRHKNGALLHVSLTVSPIRDREGNIVGAAKIARDVTEAMKSRREVEEREAHLRSILEAIPDGMIIIDDGGIILSFSAAAERLFGYSAPEICGRNVSTLMPSPDHERHDGYLSRYKKTGVRRIIGIGRTVVGRRKDGSIFPMDLAVGEVNRGGRRMFTGFVRDLTEVQKTQVHLRELQAELLHVSRLSAMGQMAATLAHELNQPLTAVMNYAEAARQMLAASGSPTPPRAMEFLQKAAGQAERAGDIIRRLRGFVEKGTVERSAAQLSDVVAEAATLATVGSKGENIRVHFDFASDLPPLWIDKVQIQQVIVNLVRNAVEVLRQADRRVIILSTKPDGGERQEVAVHDTGPGIDPSIADQLFKPFVSTKKNGMGIGLSICRSIIEAHGGRLWVEPNPEGGTVFRFVLPSSMPSTHAPESARGEAV